MKKKIELTRLFDIGRKTGKLKKALIHKVASTGEKITQNDFEKAVGSFEISLDTTVEKDGEEVLAHLYDRSRRLFLILTQDKLYLLSNYDQQSKSLLDTGKGEWMNVYALPVSPGTAEAVSRLKKLKAEFDELIGEREDAQG